MKTLIRSLRPYRTVSVLAPLFKMLEALLDLLVPLIMAEMINVGIAAHDTRFILFRCALLVLVGIVGLGFSITAQYFSAKAAVGAAADLRRSVFSHIQSLGFSEVDALGAGSLITRMTGDIQQVQNCLNMSLRLLLRSPFIVFGAAVFAFVVNAQAGWRIACSIPVLAVVIFVLMKTTTPLYIRVQERLDRLTTGVQEALTGVRVVRAFGMESKETTSFEENNVNLLAGQLYAGRRSAWMNPMTLVIVNLFTAAILYTGALQVGVGSLRQGDVIALVNYMSQILIELVKLANLIVLLTKGLASAKRIQDVMDVEPKMRYGTQTVDPEASASAVEFDGVSLRYDGAGDESLRDIAFCMRRGETLGVIGGTGSGKSSLVHLIPRFYDVTQGAVRLFGTDVRLMTRNSLRSIVGIVPQKAQLFSGTVASNLCYGAKGAVSDAQMWQALETAQAAEFVRAMPKGLESPVEQGGRNLSGGQKQRLTIARALIAQPQILILDDSASALDLATDAALRRAIRALPMTVIIVSQRISAVRNADQIIVLDDGRQAGYGTHESLLHSCDVYRDIYRSQTDDAKEAGV